MKIYVALGNETEIKTGQARPRFAMIDRAKDVTDLLPPVDGMTFAVHRGVDSDGNIDEEEGWTVTNIETGGSITEHWDTQEEAIAEAYGRIMGAGPKKLARNFEAAFQAGMLAPKVGEPAP